MADKVIVVTEKQVRNARALNEMYGYVFSVDTDSLVPADDPRSPLTIGVGNGYKVPAKVPAKAAKPAAKAKATIKKAA